MFFALDKPTGILCTDILNFIKREYSSKPLVKEVKEMSDLPKVLNLDNGNTPIKKLGHCGALDPLASGSLLIATNSDTKLITNWLNKNKTYEFNILLGISTLSGDLESKNLQLNLNQEIVSKEKINQAMQDFIGMYYQVAPLYSSVKVQGYALRDLVHNGKIISYEKSKNTNTVNSDNSLTDTLKVLYKNKELNLQIPKREQHIYDWSLLDYQVIDFDQTKKYLQNIYNDLKTNISKWQSIYSTRSKSFVYENIQNLILEIINEFELKAIATPKCTFILVKTQATVSSGTYIRQLAIDLAKELNTIGLSLNINRKFPEGLEIKKIWED